jgi:hypothetical protein
MMDSDIKNGTITAPEFFNSRFSNLPQIASGATTTRNVRSNEIKSDKLAARTKHKIVNASLVSGCK